MSKKLILAVIESDIDPQLVAHRAAWLAEISGSRLHLLYSDSEFGPHYPHWLLAGPSEEIRAQAAERVRGKIDEIAERIEKNNFQVSCEVLEERPLATTVLQKIYEHDPAIVVKGTAYHSAAERSRFLDSDWQLIRKCPRPLYLAKLSSSNNDDGNLIVAAVDPTHSHDKSSQLDRRIIEAACDMAENSGKSPALLHVHQFISGIAEAARLAVKPAALSAEEIARKIETESTESLETLAGEYGLGGEHIHFRSGNPSVEIPGFAREKNASLVVVGAVARWGIKQAVIGSTAERMLDKLPCDVLVVKSESG